MSRFRSGTRRAVVASWRDVLPIHHAAELFPPMSADELNTLSADIKKRKLLLPVVLTSEAPPRLLDGRNRLDAMELAGIDIIDTDGVLDCRLAKYLDKRIDPYKAAVALNLHRRHLTIEDKNRLIVQLLKVDPAKSNWQVAKTVGVSHPHVARVRKQAEQAGDVETVTTSVDTRGRAQPVARKPHARRKPDLDEVRLPNCLQNMAWAIETGLDLLAGDIDRRFLATAHRQLTEIEKERFPETAAITESVADDLLDNPSIRRRVH